jgi:hypothetical protein
MKKFFFVAAIVTAFAACNNSASTEAKGDSTKMSSDSSKMATDSSKMSTDSSKMAAPADSTKKDSAAKK